MTISTSGQLTLKADVTPADAGATGKYTIGPNGQSLSIPADADMVYSAALTLASGVGKVYEPDVHTYDSVALLSPDGLAVSVDTLYAIVLYNTDATVSATFTSANFGTTAWAGTLQPGATAMLWFPAGLTIGATSTITVTGQSGAPVVRVTCIGKA